MRRPPGALCALTAAALGFGPALLAGTAVAAPVPATTTTPPVQQFVKPVPVPPTLTGSSIALDEVAATHTFGTLVTKVNGKSDLTVPSFAYAPAGGANDYLGPTIEAQRGTQTTLTVTNRITGPSPMAALYYDPPMPNNDQNAPVLTAVHLHGG